MGLTLHDVEIAQLPENKLARQEKLIAQVEQLVCMRKDYITKYGAQIYNLPDMVADLVNLENMLAEMKQEAEELRHHIAEKPNLNGIHPAYTDKHKVKITTYRRHLGLGSGK
jgi:hypothetical protein